MTVFFPRFANVPMRSTMFFAITLSASSLRSEIIAPKKNGPGLCERVVNEVDLDEANAFISSIASPFRCASKIDPFPFGDG
jgi:hypothetical protein